MKRGNDQGSVYKLSGKSRRKPWTATITVGWEPIATDSDKPKFKQIRQSLGTFKTKREALDALSQHRVSPVSPKHEIITSELYEEWSKVKYPRVSHSTANNYRAAWKHIEPTLGRVTFKELRSSHWQNLIDKKANELSRSSLQKIRTLATLLYSYALQEEIVTRNYAQNIKLPRSEEQEKEIFTDLELSKMFKNTHIPYVDTILIMCYTGFRISELLSLTKFSVDFEQQILKGGSKSEAGKDRIVPISPKILPFIKRWYDKGGATLICRKDGSPLPVKVYRDDCYYKALSKLDIPRRTPHTCRHTAASLYHRAGLDPLVIQRIMGHSTYAFTADKYTHLDIKQLTDAINHV